MNAERFQKLIDAVESAPDEQFDMGHWKLNLESPECGTSACAWGWYVIKNPDCGFTLRPPEMIGGIEWNLCDTVGRYVPPMSSIARHLNIHFDDAFALFSISNLSRLTVLAQLKTFYAAHLTVGAASDASA